MQDKEKLLTPGEVAALFRVDPKTVSRWAKMGKIGSSRTLGGHRRYRESEVNALLESGLVERSSPTQLEKIVAHEKRQEEAANALLNRIFGERGSHSDSA